MATPTLISALVSECSLDINYSSLDSVIEMLTGERQRRIAEGWTELNIQINSGPYGDSNEYPYLYGKRMETMAEAEAREAKEAIYAERKKQRDREDFERLRAQFGE